MIEDLFDQRIEMNSLHKWTKTKIKPLEEKLVAWEKAWANTEVSR